MKKNLNYYCIVFLIWCLSPYIAIFVCIGTINKIKINKRALNTIFIFISLSFSLLAYSQNSLTPMGTDIERYYSQYAPILHADYYVLPILLTSEILTYIFTPVNVCLVLITRDVQIISLFWTFIIYYLLFISTINFAVIYYPEFIKQKRNIILTIIFIIFGAILFTQVTETIKSAAAISLFWYTFTQYLKNGWSIKIFILIFIGIGIHAQTLFLLPIFFYNRFKYKPLLIVALLVIILCTQINVINVIIKILPASGWMSLLVNLAEGYAIVNGEYSSKRYIFEGILCLIVSWYLYRKKIYNNSNKIGNIILLYIIIMFLNFNNSEAFVRFANFISFIAIIEFIALCSIKKIHQLSYLFLGIFIILNLQMTYGRTISGGYCSSYMDNSLSKILFSNVYDYLTYKAEY